MMPMGTGESIGVQYHGGRQKEWMEYQDPAVP